MRDTTTSDCDHCASLDMILVTDPTAIEEHNPEGLMEYRAAHGHWLSCAITAEVGGLQAKLDRALLALVEIRDRDFGNPFYLAGLARETASIALDEIREEGPDDE